MIQTVIHVGLDVDDTHYHGSALNQHTGEVVDFKCRPTLNGLFSQLAKLGRHFPGCTFKLCYEASYIAYTLQRDLTEKGYVCEVVAPTSIPSPRGKQIKTIRIDASQLVHYYANGLLTVVIVPDGQREQDRDMLRTRQKLMEQRTELRRHLQALLRRRGLHYKEEAKSKTYWTKQHYNWLEGAIEITSGSFEANLALLLQQLKNLNGILCGAWTVRRAVITGA